MIKLLFASDFQKKDINENYKFLYKINEIIEEVNNQRKELEEIRKKLDEK